MNKIIIQNLIGDLQRAAVDSVLDPANLTWQKNIASTLLKYPQLKTDTDLTTAEHLLMSAIRLEQKYLATR